MRAPERRDPCHVDRGVSGGLCCPSEALRSKKKKKEVRTWYTLKHLTPVSTFQVARDQTKSKAQFSDCGPFPPFPVCLCFRRSLTSIFPLNLQHLVGRNWEATSQSLACSIDPFLPFLPCPAGPQCPEKLVFLSNTHDPAPESAHTQHLPFLALTLIT
jgi:hypothetical protein